VPGATIRVRQHSGQPIEVTISLLKEEELDPTFRDCLPAAEQWLMAPKTQIWHAPQRELFRKNFELRNKSIFGIKKAALKALLPDGGDA
jgi:hypothetical protein